MKNLLISILLLCLFFGAHSFSYSQTTIAKEQIEDAFLLNEGGNVFGDIQATTSSIKAATLSLYLDEGVFNILKDGSTIILRSGFNIVLDPTLGGTTSGVIIPATVVAFPEGLGDKLRLYGNTYKLSVSPFDLDITSDRNIKFHSDTVEELMVILGDQGDVMVKGTISAGNQVKSSQAYAFIHDTVGDKFLLYGTLYRLAVSNNTFDFYSDKHFAWHSDLLEDAMTLDADEGLLSVKGPIQLMVYTSLPPGSEGQIIYFDHASDDNQDGVYVYTSSGWQQL